MNARIRVVLACALAAGCSGDPGDGDDGGPGPLPAPSCKADPSGSTAIAAPQLVSTLVDRWHEAWLGSPAVADLDGDGKIEIVVPREGQLIAWRADNSVAWRQALPGRIWSSPVIADLAPGRPGLEVAVAARGQIVAYDATGAVLPGFPFSWRDELRSLAAADIDGAPGLELVAVTSSPLSVAGQRDVVIAIHASGTVVSGFPPNTSGAAGCDAACYVTGGYDQNLALGDVNGDGRADVLRVAGQRVPVAARRHRPRVRRRADLPRPHEVRGRAVDGRLRASRSRATPTTSSPPSRRTSRTPRRRSRTSTATAPPS